MSNWTTTKFGEKFAVINDDSDLIASFDERSEALAFIDKYNPTDKLVIDGREEYNQRVNPASLETSVTPEQGVSMYQQLIKALGDLAVEQERTHALKEALESIMWHKDRAGHVECLGCGHLRHWDIPHREDCKVDAALKPLEKSL